MSDIDSIDFWDVNTDDNWEAIGWTYIIQGWPRNLNTIGLDPQWNEYNWLIDNLDDLYPCPPESTPPTDEINQVLEVDNSAFNSEWNDYILVCYN
ncbi:hypothetical protein DMENIID0001_096410 [Sergentomyia squamirostris]